VRIELFPKQDKLGPRGLCSLVKLPFGRHPATLRRCRMLDDDGKPIDDPAVALSRLVPAAVDATDAVIGRRLVVLPAPELIAPETVPALTEVASPRSLAEAMRAIEDGDAHKAACERMTSGCRVLQAIVTKAYEQHKLTADEARAIVYTLGLVGSSAQGAREVIAAGRASTLELDRVTRGLPSPAGCAKLRLLAESRCDCFSGTKPVPYATPALFAIGQVEPSEPRWKPFAEWLGSSERVVADPMETIGAALERIECRIEKLEKRGGGSPEGG
jgi:hypothetical protein